jgi:PAS domain S-box-containing protein
MSNSDRRGADNPLLGVSPLGSIIDLNRIEGELLESQHNLSTVFASVQVGIFIIDAETHTIVDVNPKGAAIIGFPRDQIVGSPCNRFVCQEEDWQCPITELGLCIDNAERRLLKANGECITIVKTVVKVKLHGREHLVESFLDISERIAAEEALMQSEQRYHDLLENANDLIQSVDPSGSFIYVNRAWKEAMGYSDQEIAALKVFEVISPACQGHCMLLFQEIMSGKTIPRVEVQFTAKDGRIVDLEGSINCSFVDGKPQVTRGVFRDITERKAMERELRQSEDRYRKLFENAPEAILVQSEGRYLYVNNQACSLFGVERPEQLIGTQVLSSIHPDHRESIAQRIRQVGETGLASPLQETKILRFDGSAIEVEATGTSITFQGQPATQVLIRDITERKRAEQERREWNDRLEKKVEEKTRHLKEAQAKLIQSEKMATLSEVISGASHELNNPLAGILGAIQMLRSSTLSIPIGAELMEGIDVLEDMESAAIRCQDIVDNLIRFSTQARCNFSQMDINQVLKDTLDIMEDQFAERGITVNWCTDPALPAIDGDFVKLLEVFVNLLQNSKSALPDGGTLEVTTKLVKKYAELPQVIIRIRDTGCGIPAQNLGKIFDPFFTTKPVGRGPGLGLTVSYGIIKRHGGDIDVHSGIGKGTQVTVTLPVRQPRA